MNVPFNSIANRRRKVMLNLYNRCILPIFCSLQVRDCILRGLLAEDGKAIDIHELLQIADSEN